MRNRYVLAADLPLIALAAFGAFALRFDWFAGQYRSELLPFLLMVLAIKPLVFYAFGMYQRYWAYASVRDLLTVLLATSAASLAIAVAVSTALLTHRIEEFSRSVLLIDFVLTLLAAGGLRLSVRMIADARSVRRSAAGQRLRRALVAGAGQAGGIVVREMQKNPHLGMVPAGFVDDDPAKLGKRVYGLPVVGRISDLAEAIESRQIDEVVIAMPNAPGTVVRGIAERCQRLGVVSRTVPGVFELLDGKISVSRLREVEIVDLLRRPVVAGGPHLSAYLSGRRVLVTGAGGSIGLELCRQAAYARPALLVLLGHGENSIYEARAQLAAHFPGVRTEAVIADIRDAERLNAVFARTRPAVVFHAAAHKHVPLMEENPEEAISNNVLGTRNVVDAAVRHDTQRLVLISTDKAVSPTSIMGASKRIAEELVRSAAARTGRALVVVRFGNVLGSRGSVVPLFKAQIERGGPVTITHPDMKRFFMTIPEAVALVLQAGGLGTGGELFVLNMGAPMRILDLATDLIKLSGLSEAEVPIVFTGVRPGEKLEESLWEEGAAVTPTAHPDVLEVRERNASVRLDQIAGELEAAARAGDRRQIELLLATCLPSFAPIPGVAHIGAPPHA